MKSTIRHILVFVLGILVLSCSNQKDGFLNRAYHNTTARYNGYFYARESIKEGLTAFNKTHVDDFEEILPIFIIPKTSDQAGSLSSQMDRAITKSTTVIKRHSLKSSGKERCRWIDDNYLAVGMCHFYKMEYPKANDIFAFGARDYKEDPLIRNRFQIWQARNHTAAKQLDEAGLLLSVIAQDKELPEKLKLDFYKTYADYYLARENYAKAAEMLLQAVPREKKKKNKLRLQYILAQLYARSNKPNEAIRYFETVAMKSNDYNLVFNARIFQALNVQNKVSGYRVRDQLNKMLKDDKNIEFQDQIYYAIGEINFKERRYKEALASWKQSTEVSTTNTRQKSKSFLRMAEYYFKEKQYEPAQTYYDSAVGALPDTYPEAKSIKEISANLDELVGHLRTVRTQDSLLALAALPPSELDKRLNAIVKQLQKEADEAAAAQELAALKAANAPITPVVTTTVGEFYFYNPNAMKSGANDFRKIWGARKLEDNWRRKDKTVSFDPANADATTTPADATQSTTSTANAVIIDKDELKKNIPLSTEDKTKANNLIIESLYASGTLYREKFKDNENAIESFSNLVLRYDTSRYQAIAYYQLYRLYLNKESKKTGEFFSLDTKSSSDYYRQLILTEFPNSEFARLVENPNYLKDAQANMQSDLQSYNIAFAHYKERRNPEGIALVDSILSDGKSSLLTPKFLLLKSKMQAEQQDLAGLTITLTSLANAHTSTPEGKEAARILALLQKRQVQMDSVKTTAPSPSAVANPATSTYVADSLAEHFLCLIFPNTGIDPSVYISSILNYNSSNYKGKTFDVTNTFIDNDNQVIVVKSFLSKQEAETYLKLFAEERKFLRIINIRKENILFVISVENFITFYKQKNVEEYLNFFKQHYLL